MMYMVICNKFQITGDGTQAGATQEPDTAIDLAGSQRDAPSLIESDIDNLNAVLDCEIAQNTLKNYRIQWKNFNSWALRRGIVALPADPVQVAAYLAERLERHGHRPATLRVAASAIAFAHRAAGLDNPCARPQVKRTLRGATRRAGRSQRQAEALTAEALAVIESTARIARPARGGQLESPQTAQERGDLEVALIRLMRDAMLRVSEAAALTWQDMQTLPDGTGRLLIRRSKTDPDGEGFVAFLSAQTMAAIKLMTNGATGSDSMFGLNPRPDRTTHQEGSPNSRARRRLQRPLAAGGHGTGPREGRNRTAQPDDRRALAHPRHAGALCPQRDRRQRRHRAVLRLQLTVLTGRQPQQPQVAADPRRADSRNSSLLLGDPLTMQAPTTRLLTSAHGPDSPWLIA